MASAKEQFVVDLAEKLFVAIVASQHGVSGYDSLYKNPGDMALRAFYLAKIFAEQRSLFFGFERNNKGAQS